MTTYGTAYATALKVVLDRSGAVPTRWSGCFLEVASTSTTGFTVNFSSGNSVAFAGDTLEALYVVLG